MAPDLDRCSQNLLWTRIFNSDGPQIAVKTQMRILLFICVFGLSTAQVFATPVKILEQNIKSLDLPSRAFSDIHRAYFNQFRILPNPFKIQDLIQIALRYFDTVARQMTLVDVQQELFKHDLRLGMTSEEIDLFKADGQIQPITKLSRVDYLDINPITVGKLYLKSIEKISQFLDLFVVDFEQNLDIGRLKESFKRFEATLYDDAIEKALAIKAPLPLSTPLAKIRLTSGLKKFLAYHSITDVEQFLELLPGLRPTPNLRRHLEALNARILTARNINGCSALKN